MKTKQNGYRFDYLEFSKQIRQARKGRGMTLKTVAEVLFKSQATISRYESNKVAPTLPDFLAICMFYDINPMSFLLIEKWVEKTIQMFDSTLKSDRIAS